VTVEFEAGSRVIRFIKPAAWDFMELTDDWVPTGRAASALCFGSLAQRSEESRQDHPDAVAQTSASCVRVFDVNLRAPFSPAK